MSFERTWRVPMTQLLTLHVRMRISVMCMRISVVCVHISVMCMRISAMTVAID